MNVMVDLCVVPIGVGISVSKYVAACEKIIRASNVESQLHPYGTIISGEWDTVMNVVKQCHEKVHEMGAPRITTSMRVGTRTDRKQTMDDKINSVESKLKTK